jgi:plastocyanin
MLLATLLVTLCGSRVPLHHVAVAAAPKPAVPAPVPTRVVEPPPPVAVAQGVAGGCVLSGKVTLMEGDKPVSPEGRVVVYVNRVPRAAWKSIAAEPYRVVQRKKGVEDFEFSEGMKVIVRDEIIDFVNDTDDEHNVFSQTTETFEIAKNPYKTTGTWHFSRLGTYHVQCDIHEGMRMDLLVVRNPFFAKADKDGAFALPALPPGSYELTAWERNGAEKTATVNCPSEGPVTITLEPAKQPPHRHKDNTPFIHNGSYRPRL